jgi:hypothetical protein
MAQQGGGTADDESGYSKGYAFTALDKKFIAQIFESRNEVSLKQYA